jgi:hypothetical protein
VNRRDRIAALACLLTGFLVVGEAQRLEFGMLERPGPGFMPIALGVGLIVLSAIYLAAALLTGKRPAASWGWSHWRGPLLALAAVTAYGCLLPSVGFVPTTLVFIAYWLWIIEGERPWKTLSFALLASAGLYVVFAWGLKLRLPAGALLAFLE